MHSIQLNIPNDSDYSLLLNLLRRLGIKTKPVFLDEKNGNGKKMANALGKLAKAGGIQSMSNPAKWERESRKDRNMP